MTNFRSAIACRVAHWRKMQKKYIFLIVISFGVAGFVTFFVEFFYQQIPIWIILPSLLLSLLGYYGIYRMARILYFAWKKTPCPQCGHNLGHFLIDPNYSKWPFSMIWMASFPATIKECPFCKLNFDEENIDDDVAAAANFS